ncbi:MAG: methyltransferase domain-containing protein [bacterium]|nr:methyltransferase domain-containing protein [bacterium]
MIINLIFWLFSIILLLAFLHLYSYHYLKWQVVRSKKWDLNISCGKTDGGGVNADIAKHANLPNFVFLKDIYHLPFKDKQFDTILCSHTIEHVDNPKVFYQELKRVGKEVTLITPPIWDVYAALNFISHKWIILAFKKTHSTLPRMIPYPLGFLYAKLFKLIVKI